MHAALPGEGERRAQFGVDAGAQVRSPAELWAHTGTSWHDAVAIAFLLLPMSGIWNAWALHLSRRAEPG
jgi:hypothetical protein